MRVLFATAELAPVARVGGLAQAAAGLVAALRTQGVTVDVVLPDYSGTPLAGETVRELGVPDWVGPARVRTGAHPVAGELHLVDVPGLARPHPYTDETGHGWPDNDHRFLAFSQAVVALVGELAPDVLHLNDWHTAAVLAALEPAPPAVLSIHNLAYQGVCDGGWLRLLGPRADAYESWGGCNPLVGGLRLADAIVAVSPTYADEIRQPEHGHGLDGVLRSRGEAVIGIRNGIDTNEWDPAVDPHLSLHYDAKDPAPKQQLKAALRRELGLDESEGALAVMVTRLTGQKGVDLVLPLVRFLPRLPAQLAVLGAGESGLADALHAAAVEHPGAVAFVAGYDEGLGHRLFAGGDLFLMPSRFEPCGLAQMQAMRYGTIPVVTDVGGLHDTVVDADADPRRGTGFVAPTPDAPAVLDALHRAVRAWAGVRRRRKVQRLGMAADWSWAEPAARHLELYRKLAAHGPPSV